MMVVTTLQVPNVALSPKSRIDEAEGVRPRRDSVMVSWVGVA